MRRIVVSTKKYINQVAREENPLSTCEKIYLMDNIIRIESLWKMSMEEIT
jgi:hypothetical protein